MVKPILFSGAMVRALLDGSKTQTRRVVKLPKDAREVQYYSPPSGRSQSGWADPGVNYWTPDGTWDEETGKEICSNHIDPCPYGQPGDLLWVRETWGVLYPQYIKEAQEPTFYKADGDDRPGRWRPSIHMPRMRSRLTLELTDVRVQLLTQISREDRIAEGLASGSAVGFRTLWDSINAKRGHGWDTNPWVWALTFKVHRINVDRMLHTKKAA